MRSNGNINGNSIKININLTKKSISKYIKYVKTHRLSVLQKHLK